MKNTARGKIKNRTENHASVPKKKTVREVVGVFQDPGKLQAAIDELQSHGFMRQEISVLAGQDTIQEKLGHLYKHVQKAEDDPKAPRIIFVANEEIRTAEAAAIGIPLYIAVTSATGAVVAGGGALLEAIIYAATAGAVGAGIGSILATFLARQHAEYLHDQIHRGGLLLWVHLRSPRMEKPAKDILLKHSAQDVHAHDIPVYKE